MAFLAPLPPVAHTSPEISQAATRRSATLGVDPKMREMNHFLQSHGHEERLRDVTDFRQAERSAGPPKSPRSVAAVCREATALEDHDPDYLHGTEAVQDRLDWRAQIDRKLKRLMQDTVLDLDGRIPKGDQHRLRCSHLDRTYDWYTKHGMKEARKEREAPKFVSFDPSGPRMAGSLRRAPDRPEVGTHSLPLAVQRSSPASSSSSRAVSYPCLLGGSSSAAAKAAEGSKQSCALPALAEEDRGEVRTPRLGATRPKASSLAPVKNEKPLTERQRKRLELGKWNI
eukprot:TRINITY_DN14545_c0_g8_i1.p1 TRINITY_DN14545_c0_g8~~TRINITY_DN14545_c0_g8_i1.p1  ORF type:complete len:306 (-),score=65.86 TRINITY_DN14545_c0_g8_i1:142-996(-)